MHDERDAIEPPEAWLAHCREELKFGPASIGTSTQDTRLAKLVLATIEVEGLEEPRCDRDLDGAVLINWRHDPEPDQSRCLSIRVLNGQVFFCRHHNARPIPVPRRMLAKGTAATARELLQWTFHADIHRRVQVSELLRGE